MHLMRLLFISGAFIKYSAMPPGEWTMTVEGREISQKGDKISARIMASVCTYLPKRISRRFHNLKDENGCIESIDVQMFIKSKCWT